MLLPGSNISFILTILQLQQLANVTEDNISIQQTTGLGMLVHVKLGAIMFLKKDTDVSRTTCKRHLSPSLQLNIVYLQWSTSSCKDAYRPRVLRKLLPIALGTSIYSSVHFPLPRMEVGVALSRRPGLDRHVIVSRLGWQTPSSSTHSPRKDSRQFVFPMATDS